MGEKGKGELASQPWWKVDWGGDAIVMALDVRLNPLQPEDPHQHPSR